ncbi:hypothetical protein [Actinoplanes sp. NPDC049681]|uniref:hypothetical protein n=1 Tax=Actinoplanes sp. NPDC049681 TaxID=3363905 RepID=UPI0037B16A8D
MTSRSTTPRSRPKPAWEKLAPKKFQPIPDDAPARELGEYMRAMVRDAGISLDRFAAAGGMAKNTFTTTMDGRSKGWESVENWIKAYTNAYRAPYTRQMEDLRRYFDIGRERHLAALRQARAAKADRATAPPAPSPAPPGPVDAAATLPPLYAQRLVAISIKLPKRTPGAGIDPVGERFLEGDEILERVRYLKQIRRARELGAASRLRAPARPVRKGRPATGHEPVWFDLTSAVAAAGVGTRPKDAPPHGEELPTVPSPAAAAALHERSPRRHAGLRRRGHLPEPLHGWLLAAYPLLLIVAGIAIIATSASLFLAGAAAVTVGVLVLLMRLGLRDGYW